MKVEIWSDVMCPFCYIGKRKFELALEQFSEKDSVEVVWKSFQLDPGLITDPTKNVYAFLAERKGWTLEYSRQINNHVTKLAEEVGLVFNFDKAVVANSFDAHRLSHLAKKFNVQNQAEERLFSAYFTDGKNTARHETLVELGVEIGLDASDVQKMLQSDAFAEDVRTDIYESHQIGIRGVPFFLFNNKYSISGAQDISVFSEVLNTVNKEVKNGV